MNLEQRIAAFSQLGEQVKTISLHHDGLFQNALQGNPWFTKESVIFALQGIERLLDKEALKKWTSAYDLANIKTKTVGVAMAGNIPLVGFHDFLCVLVTGHRLKAKLSSQDTVLLYFLSDLLIKIEPEFKNVIQFSDRLREIDAMIATGSDNTSRYFEYYFRNIPHIIRKNRSSAAVIYGNESPDELESLGTDVFTYFGLGCRNVAKLYVPEKYDFSKLFHAWKKHETVLNHSKYFNNYEYQKSILLVNKIPFFDNGFVLLQLSEELVSPISVLFFEYFANPQDLDKKIGRHKSKIQCIVSARQQTRDSEHFGQAQFPALSDYADQLDTLQFLAEI